MKKSKIVGIVLAAPFIILGLITLIWFLTSLGEDHSAMVGLGVLLAILFVPFLIGAALYTRKS